eukprot:jgi/Hompol1/2116/HPOL_002832-RA
MSAPLKLSLQPPGSAQTTPAAPTASSAQSQPASSSQPQPQSQPQSQSQSQSQPAPPHRPTIIAAAPTQRTSSKDVDEALTEAPIEEHLILRLPPALANRLRDPIQKRALPSDLSLVFHDARKGTLTLNKTQYPAHLVDLPCIIESLKTIDNKQFYKIADIAQMIIVDPVVKIPKDGLWPDGISPPMWNVRKRRFRKRISKKTIEDIEQEVERLLVADAEAIDVRYGTSIRMMLT